ncbi:MAG: alcohol acetyltransferase [Oscillospiraceae bacterium]|jgi:NRPS condensation-like uncharacterized protein|nr:alcohol acetyltransferase [Oscillospiraceae bacterium]
MSNKNYSVPPLTWFKIDTAGKVFPGQNTSTWSNVFRLTVILNVIIDPELLRDAVIQVLPRFPCFDVEMHRGLFWYYLEKNRNKCPPILPDIKNPCTRFKWHENSRFLFRVYYRENRISVEFFHALTDAFGASRFLCTLAAQYLRLLGHDIPFGESVLDLNEQASPDELEDAFPKFATSDSSFKFSSSAVYHPKGIRMPAHSCNITTGFLSIWQLKEKASKYNVTITEFVTAVMLHILYQKQMREQRRQKMISAQIPVNLRNSFSTDTLRNFSLCYQVDIDPKMGEYTFEDIVKHTSLFLRYINNVKNLNAMITGNMKLERNMFTRVVPLFLKNMFMGIYFSISAEYSTSLLFSNVGLIKLPDEMKPYVNSFMLLPPHGIRSSARTGAIGYGDVMSISFTNSFESLDIERDFFKALVKMGLHVKIESNRD